MSHSHTPGGRDRRLSDPFGNVILALLLGFVPLFWSLLMIGQMLALGRFAADFWAQGLLLLCFGSVGFAGVGGMRRALAREVRISEDNVTLVRFIGAETIAWSDIARFEVAHLDAEAASYLGANVRLHDGKVFRLPLGPLMGVTKRSPQLYRYVDQLNSYVA